MQIWSLFLYNKFPLRWTIKEEKAVGTIVIKLPLPLKYSWISFMQEFQRVDSHNSIKINSFKGLDFIKDIKKYIEVCMYKKNYTPQSC